MLMRSNYWYIVTSVQQSISHVVDNFSTKPACCQAVVCSALPATGLKSVNTPRYNRDQNFTDISNATSFANKLGGS